MDIVNDVINLKTQHGLLESDATYSKQVEWYKFLLENNMLTTVYKDSKLCGFYEFIRLDRIPKTFSEFKSCASDYISGKLVLVCNAISDCKETMWELLKETRKRSIGATHCVWHNKKNDEVKVFQLNRRMYAANAQA